MALYVYIARVLPPLIFYSLSTVPFSGFLHTSSSYQNINLKSPWPSASAFSSLRPSPRLARKNAPRNSRIRLQLWKKLCLIRLIQSRPFLKRFRKTSLKTSLKVFTKTPLKMLNKTLLKMSLKSFLKKILATACKFLFLITAYVINNVL